MFSPYNKPLRPPPLLAERGFVRDSEFGDSKSYILSPRTPASARSDRSDVPLLSESLPRMKTAGLSLRDSFRGIWPKLLTHLFAGVVTLAVVQLSWRNVYWMDLQSPNVKISPGLTQGGALSFLQLVAKLHELLIVASVSAIVIQRIQHHLTGRSGLPLGMIANAFELNSGRFLRTKSFWASMWARDSNSKKRFPFVYFWLLTFFSVVLVTLSGPSSAIAIIPSLHYFDLHHPFNQTVMPYYVFNQSTELWPQTLTQASINGPASNLTCDIPAEGNNALTFYCLTSGFQDLFPWGGGLLYQNTDKGSNISFSDTIQGTRRLVSVQSCDTKYDGRASGVSMTAAINQALTAYWNFASKNFAGIALKAAQPHITLDPSAEVFGPRVEVLCNSYSNDLYNASDYKNTVGLQPDMTFPTFDGTIIPVPGWTYEYYHAQDVSNVSFVSLPSGEKYPSIGVVITIPLVKPINGTVRQATENLACSIYGQWIPQTPNYEPTVSDHVSYTIDAPLGSTCLSSPSTDSEKRPINTTISMEYARAINQPIVFHEGPIHAVVAVLLQSVNSPSAFLANSSEFLAPIAGLDTGNGTNETAESDRRSRAKLVSSLLAGIVTDGMARIAASGNQPYAAPIFILPERNNSVLVGRYPINTAEQGRDDSLNTTSTPEEMGWIKINPMFQRYGYGYRWQGSRTTQFGICVLLIHAVVAIGHMCWLLSAAFRGRGIIKSWETIPEVLALALGSRKGVLKEERVWKDAVAVRETDKGTLEMIVGPDCESGLGPPRTMRKCFYEGN